MNQELLLAQKLQELKDLAKIQGNILEQDQLNEVIEELKLGEDKLSFLYDYFRELHIGIGESIAPESYLEQEEVDYLNIYLEELKELPAVSQGEREAIFLSAMAGDIDACGKLIEVFLPDVVEIAKLYAGQGVLLEDLIGEGNVAVATGVELLGAAENEKDAEGMLARIVMDAMEEYIQECTSISQGNQKLCKKVNKVADKARELSELLLKDVTVEELMEETGMTEKYIMDAYRLSGKQMEHIEKPSENND